MAGRVIEGIGVWRLGLAALAAGLLLVAGACLDGGNALPADTGTLASGDSDDALPADTGTLASGDSDDALPADTGTLASGDSDDALPADTGTLASGDSDYALPADTGTLASGDSDDALPTVTGTLTSQENVGRRPRGPLSIELYDITNDRTIGVHAVESLSGFSFPYSFSIPYDPADVDPSSTYMIRARVDVYSYHCGPLCGESQYFISNWVEPRVLTQGHPSKDIEVELDLVMYHCLIERDHVSTTRMRRVGTGPPTYPPFPTVVPAKAEPAPAKAGEPRQRFPADLPPFALSLSKGLHLSYRLPGESRDPEVRKVRAGPDGP